MVNTCWYLFTPSDVIRFHRLLTDTGIGNSKNMTIYGHKQNPWRWNHRLSEYASGAPYIFGVYYYHRLFSSQTKSPKWNKNEKLETFTKKHW